MNKEQDDKRIRILNAAQECFTLYGFKRTVMDDIAQKAGISRPALYLSFPNKEAIFRSLAEELHKAALSRAEAALEGGGTLEERLIAAFEGKDLEFITIVEHSAHGVELVDMKDTIAADIAEQAEHRSRELFAQALRKAELRGELTFDRVEMDASQCAEILLLAVAGIKQPPSSLAPYRQRLPRLIRVFCTAL